MGNIKNTLTTQETCCGFASTYKKVHLFPILQINLLLYYILPFVSETPIVKIKGDTIHWYDIDTIYIYIHIRLFSEAHSWTAYVIRN